MWGITKISPASDPKQCVERSSGGHGRHRDKTHERSSRESMSVFSFHMKSKLFKKNRCLGSWAASLATSMSRYALFEQYCRISAKSICQDPLQNSCARAMCRDSRLQHPWTLCKIYVCKSSRRAMAPDPCLRFHMCKSSTRCITPNLCLGILICGPSARSMSHDPVQDPRLRIIGKIHVSGNRRPEFSYPCLNIRIFGSIYKHPQDPRLRIICKIHVSGSSAHRRDLAAVSTKSHFQTTFRSPSNSRIRRASNFFFTNSHSKGKKAKIPQVCQKLT